MPCGAQAGRTGGQQRPRQQGRAQPQPQGQPTAPTAGPAIVFDDPTTYNSATSLSVYDALGQDIALTYYFQKADPVASPDTWEVYITANGEPLTLLYLTPGVIGAPG